MRWRQGEWLTFGKDTFDGGGVVKPHLHVVISFLVPTLLSCSASNDARVAPREPNNIPAISSPKQFSQFNGSRIRVTGTATTPSKGLPEVRLANGDRVLVALGLAEWPAAVEGKHIEVTGVVTEEKRFLDKSGNPVDANGDFVQDYAGREPVYFLTNCEWKKAKD